VQILDFRCADGLRMCKFQISNVRMIFKCFEVVVSAQVYNIAFSSFSIKPSSAHLKSEICTSNPHPPLMIVFFMDILNQAKFFNIGHINGEGRVFKAITYHFGGVIRMGYYFIGFIAGQ